MCISGGILDRIDAVIAVADNKLENWSDLSALKISRFVISAIIRGDLTFPDLRTGRNTYACVSTVEYLVVVC